MAAVGEVEAAVEQIKVRRAGRDVGFGHRLIGIKEVGEGPIVLLGESDHFVRRIGGEVFDVVGIDGHDTDALALAFLGEASQRAGEMDDERAVVADKHDQQTIRTAQVIQGVMGASGVGELDFRCGAAEGENAGGGDFSHDIG